MELQERLSSFQASSPCTKACHVKKSGQCTRENSGRGRLVRCSLGRKQTGSSTGWGAGVRWSDGARFGRKATSSGTPAAVLVSQRILQASQVDATLHEKEGKTSPQILHKLARLIPCIYNHVSISLNRASVVTKLMYLCEATEKRNSPISSQGASVLGSACRPYSSVGVLYCFLAWFRSMDQQWLKGVSTVLQSALLQACRTCQARAGLMILPFSRLSAEWKRKK